MVGEKIRKINWVNFTRFLKKEPTQKYLDILKKGAYIAVDGRLETNKREVDGKVYNNMEVIVNNLDIPFPPAGTTSTEDSSSDSSTESTDMADQSDLPF
jgi:single-stranded DNA-binding protein